MNDAQIQQQLNGLPVFNGIEYLHLFDYFASYDFDGSLSTFGCGKNGKVERC